jgi:hypothetical protein
MNDHTCKPFVLPLPDGRASPHVPAAYSLGASLLRDAQDSHNDDSGTDDQASSPPESLQLLADNYTDGL